MNLTFNLDAVPFAAFVIVVGTLQFVFRARWWTRLQKRRWDDPRRSSTKLRDRYSMFLAAWCLAGAAFALFHNFG